MGQKSQASSLEDQSDEALAELAKEELPYRTVAYDELVRRHYAGVRRLAIAQLGGSDEADALAQDVMLRVFGSIRTFRGEAKFTTWLYRIVENLARTRIRQQIREREKREAYAASYAEEDSAATHELLSDPSEFQQLLQHLSPDERTLLALRFVDDMELHEIAEVLGLGLSAVKMRYYRTLEKLKKHVDVTPPS